MVRARGRALIVVLNFASEMGLAVGFFGDAFFAGFLGEVFFAFFMCSGVFA